MALQRLHFTLQQVRRADVDKGGRAMQNHSRLQKVPLAAMRQMRKTTSCWTSVSRNAHVNAMLGSLQQFKHCLRKSSRKLPPEPSKTQPGGT